LISYLFFELDKNLIFSVIYFFSAIRFWTAKDRFGKEIKIEKKESTETVGTQLPKTEISNETNLSKKRQRKL
jgi:hypothetical protein